MVPTLDYLKNELKKRNIRLSAHRLHVLEYMCRNPVHPTADQIYLSIKKDVPNLSRTTVYNTLHTLLKAGLVRVISIEDTEARYDIKTDDHGHFKCLECGTVINFSIDFTALPAGGLDGFKVTDKGVYFKGVCSKCLANINTDNKI
jgi:Fe2+ or Zn2+ uptake regulation protein